MQATTAPLSVDKYRDAWENIKMATHDIIDVANIEDQTRVMAAFTTMKKVDAMWTNNL